MRHFSSTRGAFAPPLVGGYLYHVPTLAAPHLSIARAMVKSYIISNEFPSHDMQHDYTDIDDKSYVGH